MSSFYNYIDFALYDTICINLDPIDALYLSCNYESNYEKLSSYSNYVTSIITDTVSTFSALCPAIYKMYSLKYIIDNNTNQSSNNHSNAISYYDISTDLINNLLPQCQDAFFFYKTQKGENTTEIEKNLLLSIYKKKMSLSKYQDIVHAYDNKPHKTNKPIEQKSSDEERSIENLSNSLLNKNPLNNENDLYLDQSKSSNSTIKIENDIFTQSFSFIIDLSSFGSIYSRQDCKHILHTKLCEKNVYIIRSIALSNTINSIVSDDEYYNIISNGVSTLFMYLLSYSNKYYDEHYYNRMIDAKDNKMLLFTENINEVIQRLFKDFVNKEVEKNTFNEHNNLGGIYVNFISDIPFMNKKDSNLLPQLFDSLFASSIKVCVKVTIKNIKKIDMASSDHIDNQVYNIWLNKVVSELFIRSMQTFRSIFNYYYYENKDSSLINYQELISDSLNKKLESSNKKKSFNPSIEYHFLHNTNDTIIHNEKSKLYIQLY